MFQIKQGCGTSVENINTLQEAQRKLPTLFDNVKIMSTNPVSHQEGCHFPKAGYITHATNIVRLLKADLYNHQDTTDIYAPNILYIGLSSANELKIHTSADGGIVWENGAHRDFKLHNTSVIITGGRVAQSIIYLTTSASLSSLNNIKLSYTSRSSAGAPAVKNKKGVGLLCFNQVSLSKLNQEIDFEQIPDTALLNSRILLKSTSTSGLPISVSDLTSGIYFIQPIIKTKESTLIKFIKK